MLKFSQQNIPFNDFQNIIKYVKIIILNFLINEGFCMILDKANIIRQKRKSVKISINSGGELTIICPFNLPYTKLEEIVKSKESLLNKKIKNAAKIENDNKEIINYKKILLLGKEYYIIPTDKVGKAYFADDNFLVPYKYTLEKSKLTNFIKKNLKEIATKVIKNRVNDIVKSHANFNKINNISIGSFKSKWGSCDSLCNVKFNWKVVMLCPKLIDFIIFHELTHLKELNHSQLFYKNLQNVCPDHKQSRLDLKKYSFLLTLY